MNLLTTLVELSFQILRKHSAGYDEVDELLPVLEQLFNTNTVGLFIWDEELNTIYPLGVQGADVDSLMAYVGEAEQSVWKHQSLVIEAQLASQIEPDRAEPSPILFPLWRHGDKLGLLAFIWTKEVDLSLLEEVLIKVNDFLLCVDSVRKNRTLEKKSIELIQTKTSLENTLKISTSVQNQLEDMAAKLKIEAAKSEKANRAKSEFLSSMSHELRTPLNVIMGFSQLIENSKLTDDQRENITEVLRASDHLIDMVNEVLDLSKIEAGKFEINLSEVDLFDLVNRSIVLIGPLAHKNNISINNQISFSGRKIVTDEIKLKQVLINLLSNAAKYNKHNGSITIRCDDVDNEYLKIEVIDTGNGISDEHLDQAFHAFERLAITNGSIEGAGVGLAICKSLIESLGGQIGVESTLDQGSCFWVRLPLKGKLET